VPPPATRDEDEDEEDDEPAAEPHWVDRLMPHVASLMQVVVPMVVSWGGRKAEGAPSNFRLAEIFDWRKAAEKGRQRKQPVSPSPAPPPSLPPHDPADMAHFIAVQAALTPEESALARAIAAELSPDELRGWFAELKQLSVAEAVAKIRTLLAGSANSAA
jgi:hypothetical protein